MPKRVYADERARKSIASVSLAFVSHRPPIARYAFLPLFLSLRLPRALDPRAHDHHHRGSRPRSMDDRESNARPHLALLRAPSSVPLASRASRPTALARHRSRARIFTSPRRVHDRLARRRRRRRRPERARPSAIRARWARARMRRHASESGSESTRRDARRPRRDARDGARSASSYLGALR